MRDWLGSFFTAEDFDKTITTEGLDKFILTITGKSGFSFGSLAHDVYGVIANKANAILREEIAKAPVVYGPHLDPHMEEVTDWSTEARIVSAHQARLICVEEIEKEPPNWSGYNID